MRIRVLVAVAVFGAPLVAAPVPKGADKKVVYFPTEVGAKWVYETADGEQESAVVSAVEKGEDGALTVSRTGADGTRTVYAPMVVSPDGLRQARDGVADLSWVLKARAKAGDSWDSQDGKRTLHGPEEVTVPAGTFTALRVSWERNGTTYSSWYVAGIGEVKRSAKTEAGELVRRALKSFLLKAEK